MPLTIVIPDLNGRITRRLVEFEAGGDSEPILYYNAVAGETQRFWIRKTTFSPSMLKEPVYRIVNASGESMSATLPEAGMQALIDRRQEELRLWNNDSNRDNNDAASQL